MEIGKFRDGIWLQTYWKATAGLELSFSVDVQMSYTCVEKLCRKTEEGPATKWIWLYLVVFKSHLVDV